VGLACGRRIRLGLSIAHQGDILFAVWYTHNPDGTPLWLTVAAAKSGPGRYDGTLYRTTGPGLRRADLRCNAGSRDCGR
jgi:hypothetical protein